MLLERHSSSRTGESLAFTSPTLLKSAARPTRVQSSRLPKAKLFEIPNGLLEGDSARYGVGSLLIDLSHVL